MVSRARRHGLGEGAPRVGRLAAVRRTTSAPAGRTPEPRHRLRESSLESTVGYVSTPAGAPSKGPDGESRTAPALVIQGKSRNPNDFSMARDLGRFDDHNDVEADEIVAANDARVAMAGRRVLCHPTVSG